MTETASSARRILVVGAGVAAHRFVACLLRDPGAPVRVTMIGEEGRGPYDRSALTSLLSGADPAELELDRAVLRDDRVRLIRDERVLHIDRAHRTVRTRSRRTYAYDTLVLATGSYAARVAVEGSELPGCFVFRSIEDAEAVRDFVASRSRERGRPLRGAVIGGGLHGLRAALALSGMGVSTTVVQYPDRLLSAHLDPVAASTVRAAVEAQGVTVRTHTRTTRLDPDESGAVTALEFQDGTFERADVVVFTVGVRPRDELARNAGLAVDPRGGVVIDDRCGTSDPHILAIGEVARLDEREVSFVGAAQVMGEVAAARVLGGDERLLRVAESVHATLGGVAFASFGDPLLRVGAVEVVTHRDTAAGVCRKLVFSDDARTLLGGILVGDTGDHEALRAAVGSLVSADVAAQLLPAGDGATDDLGICDHIGTSHARLVADLRSAEVSRFSTARPLVGRDGCDDCTLAIARALLDLVRSRAGWSGVAEPLAAVCPTAPLRTDGTWTVRPWTREMMLSPADLVALGQIAEEFRLQPRIVEAGIELHGARPAQLAPLIERLAAAGLAPGDGERAAGETRPATELRPDTRPEAPGRSDSAQGRRASAPVASRGAVSVANGWGYRLVGAEP